MIFSRNKLWSKIFFHSCPRHCNREIIVVIIYSFQIWNKKEHIIVNKAISSYMVLCILRHPIYTHTDTHTHIYIYIYNIIIPQHVVLYIIRVIINNEILEILRYYLKQSVKITHRIHRVVMLIIRVKIYLRNLREATRPSKNYRNGQLSVVDYDTLKFLR